MMTRIGKFANFIVGNVVVILEPPKSGYSRDTDGALSLHSFSEMVGAIIYSHLFFLREEKKHKD